MMTRWSTNVSYFGRLLIVLLGTTLNPVAPAVAAQSSSKDIADAYVKARRNVMSESASAADVDELLALYDPNVVYEHPSVGIRIGGRTAIRQGTISFLSQTKDRYSGTRPHPRRGRGSALPAGQLPGSR